MNRIIIKLSSIVACILLLGACNEDRIVYSGADSVMFADTVNVLPVQDNSEIFDISISAMQKVSYDRTFAVEIVESKSTAIEGVHYTIPSYSVTIKANETAGVFKIKGIATDLPVNYNKGITIRLVNKNISTDIYGDDLLKSKVIFKKVCPFDLTTFTGYCTLTSTWFKDYMKNTDMRLLSTEIDPENENTIIIKDMFYKGFDVKVRLDNSNSLTPDLYMDAPAIIGGTDEAFGTIYGNGELKMEHHPGAISYYSSCEAFMVQSAYMFVDGVGVVGSYANILRFISDEEAEVLKRQGY